MRAGYSVVKPEMTSEARGENCVTRAAHAAGRSAGVAAKEQYGPAADLSAPK